MTDKDRQSSEERGLLVSVFGSLLVGCAGMVFWILTEAEAIMLDGVFNLTYFVTGLFALKVARLMRQGENDDFPMGYGYFEPLVNGGKGLLMLGVTVMALISAVAALFSGGRGIALGLAVIYGILATIICWSVALLIRGFARRSGSPLVQADAANWVINAAISSAVLATLLIVFLIRNTALRTLVPYVDPLLVVVIGSITIGVPVRMAWTALMELLNRTPSPAVLAEARGIIEKAVSELEVRQLSVRVLQPGRTRIIAGHVLLAPGAPGHLRDFDAIRANADAALKAIYPLSAVDLVFTCDPRWSAPLTETH
jgi:cation diffusion facilitator family transporter